MKAHSFKRQRYQVSYLRIFSLFQALGQWGLPNAAGRRRRAGSGSVFSPDPARPAPANLFQSTPLTESLEQVTDISLFLPLIVDVTLPDLMIYFLSNPGDTTR